MNATFEPGLPATGPLAVHIHDGQPTPWREGCVVRIEPDDAPPWIANVQSRGSDIRQLVVWEQARAIVIIAGGSCYFVRPAQPEQWEHICHLAIDCVLAPDRSLAVIVTETGMVALATDGTTRWQFTTAYGVDIQSIDEEFICGTYCNYDDESVSFRVRWEDGTDGELAADKRG